MKPDKLFCELIFAFFLLFGAFAEGSIMPYGETGRIPMSENLAFRVEMQNDSLGCLSQKDWDDLRTFGMYFGMSFRNWAFEVNEDAMTNRATDSASRGRIDQLHASVSRRLFSVSGDPGSVSLSGGAGLLYLGDMGLREVQKEFHASYGNIRPVPESYDTPEKRLIVLGEGVLQAHWKSLFIPLGFFSSIEAGHTGFLRTGNFVDASVLDGFLGVDLFGGFRWAANYSQQGETFSETMKSENGLQVGAAFRAGFFETGYAYNLFTTRQAAYAALSFSGNERKPDTLKDERMQAIEFGMYPVLGEIRVRTSVIWEPLVISPVLGADSGNMYPAGISIPETEIYQYEQLYAGIDLSRSIMPWMDGYVMGAGGIRKEQHRTRTIAVSQILAERTGSVFLAESGVRLFIPQKGKTDNEWGLGIAVGAAYANALKPGLYPYVHIQLLGVTGRKK